MIVAGDVAVAPGDSFAFRGFPEAFRRRPLCVNLEGAIIEAEEWDGDAVCNSPAVWESFAQFEPGPVFLANNHIRDFSGGIAGTKRKLAGMGLRGFGAGASQAEAARPAVCTTPEGDYILCGFGWRVIGCWSATRRRSGVNPLDGRVVESQLEGHLEAHPSKRVVVVLHWSYEFERYPQPGHRELAFRLIDAGAYAVIGHHSHVVGPVERYRDRTIAYGLGNWAFSHGRFHEGRLRLPESSFHGLAIELGAAGDRVHHVRFRPPNTVQYEHAEDVVDSALSVRPAFEGMGHREYLRWFKEHRIKRRGLPIYTSTDRSVPNRLRDALVMTRHFGIITACALGLKGQGRNA